MRLSPVGDAAKTSYPAEANDRAPRLHRRRPPVGNQARQLKMITGSPGGARLARRGAA